MQTRPHRLIFHNDGRHTNLYQFEAPMAREQLELVVDEIVGTPVDTLFYCTGDGRTQIYDTKVGELWGHNVKDWQHIVFYRAAENARLLIDAGLDPLRIVCDRAHEKGLSFFPSLIVQQPRDHAYALPSGRCSDFWQQNTHLFLGADEGLDEVSADMPDFAHPAIREERFVIVDELITRYPIDGVELHLDYFFPFFKPGETERNLPLLTDWVRRIRRRMDEVGRQRGQLVELAVRVPGTIWACRQVGIDLETWVREGLVNLVCPATLDGNSDADVMQQDMDVTPLVDLTRGTGCQVCGVIGSEVRGEEHTLATLPHYRAAATNLWRQGVDGIHLPSFWSRWPYDSDSYAILRELAHPDVMAWGDKRYFVPTETQPLPRMANCFGYDRPLPRPVAADGPAEATFTISDDLGRAQAQVRLVEVALHLRLLGAERRDLYEVRLNGGVLPASLLERRDFTYYMRAPRYRAGFGYWLDYRLDADHWPMPGENSLSVRLLDRAPELAVPLVLRDVELMVKYRPGRNWWRWDGLTAAIP